MSSADFTSELQGEKGVRLELNKISDDEEGNEHE